jgi:protein-tyrosine phosphatase
MKLFVYSQKAVIDIALRFEEPWHWVTIRTLVTDIPILQGKLPPLCQGRLDLVFYDQSPLSFDFRPLIEFIEENKPTTLLVNCEAGISRSAGVAVALDEIYNGARPSEWTKWKPLYNKSVTKLVKEAYYDYFP